MNNAQLASMYQAKAWHYYWLFRGSHGWVARRYRMLSIDYSKLARAYRANNLLSLLNS